jgi:hypothetical protein
MAHFEQVGVLMAIVPMGIAQNIRYEHDRAYYAYFRENRTWQRFTVVYYLILLVVALVAAARGVHLIDIPLVAFIVMMMCPFIFIMVYGDIKTCGQVERE